MTDEDIMLKATALVSQLINKTCILRSFARKDRTCQQCYRLVLYGDKAKALMIIMVQYMGFRRRKRIWQALNKYIPKKAEFDIASFLNSLPPSNVIPIKRRA